MIRALRRTWKRLLESIFHRNADGDLADELDSHIQLLTDEHIRRGLPPEEARRRARVQFGSVEATKERYRDARGLPALDVLSADVRYSVRRLWARPGYALLAVLTLALGIGGTASVYGVARGVLFDPLPYANEREVGVFWKKTDWIHEEFLHIRGRVPGFQQVALYRQRDVILRNGNEPARLVPGASASAELFDVLGARPILGRGFLAGEDVEGAERVAVLSFGLWLELGGNPSAIGTHVTIDGRPLTVVGVMPRGFWFPDPSVRIWTPERLTPESRRLELHAGRPRRTEPGRPGHGRAGSAADGHARRAIRLSRAVGQDEGRAHHAAA